MLDERWTRPELAGGGRGARCAGRRIEAVEQARQVPARRPRRRSDARHAPADDRQPAVRSAGSDGGRRHDGDERLGGRASTSRPRPGTCARGSRSTTGRSCWFTDARRFGHAVVLDGDELDGVSSPPGSGIEPLGGDADRRGALPARRRPARAAEVVSAQPGPGSPGSATSTPTRRCIAPQLHPLSPAGSMKPEHCEELRDGIVAALEAGLATGGASIDDYRDARGERGSMQDEFLVHTREGEPCLRCGDGDPAGRGRRAARPTSARLPDAPARPPAATRGRSGR